ncbi:MAG TPA: hypothetical protein VNC50_00945, partial [Planctomycetia bacterium]|nr:hypothetical protein [Planctomycetia bacterium]
DRAGRGESPFDFSEQACYRCHHGLTGAIGRAQSARLGDGDWGAPYFSVLAQAAELGGSERKASLVTIEEMRRKLAARMRGGATTPEEKTALDRLAKALSSDQPFRPPTEGFKFDAARAPVDWEDAYSLYHALRAFDPKSPRLTETGDLLPLLRFPSRTKGEASWQGPALAFPKPQ